MRATRVFANLRVGDVDVARSLYTEYLGLRTEEFNMGWVARDTSRHRGECSVVTRDASTEDSASPSIPTTSTMPTKKLRDSKLESVNANPRSPRVLHTAAIATDVEL
jgi:hypothetical protein